MTHRHTADTITDDALDALYERAEAAFERVRAARDRMAHARDVDAIWCLDVLDTALVDPGPAATQATDTTEEH